MANSCARSMIACASPAGVSDPKFMVPRQSRLTLRPDRPRCVYSMPPAFHGSVLSDNPRPAYRIPDRPRRRPETGQTPLLAVIRLVRLGRENSGTEPRSQWIEMHPIAGTAIHRLRQGRPRHAFLAVIFNAG